MPEPQVKPYQLFGEQDANLFKLANPDDIVVFTGTANQSLAEEICKLLGVPLSIGVSRFSDDEVKGTLKVNVRGKHVFIFQPTNPPAEHWDELHFMIDAAKLASAKEITVIMSYAGYSRQERKDEPRVSISFKVKLRHLENVGVRRIIACDLHASASQGFVDIPFDNLFVPPFLLASFAQFFTPENIRETCLVTDLGYGKVADVYADLLGCELVLARKKRKGPDELEEKVILVGDVKKRAIVIDDLASTFRTANRIGKAVKEAGAKYIAAAMVHPILSEDTKNPKKDVIANLRESPFEDIAVSNTVFIPPEKIGRIETAIAEKSPPGRLHIVSCAPLLAMAIKEIYIEGSVSGIFDEGKRRLKQLAASPRSINDG